MDALLGYFYWDPSRFLFTIPGINWPLGWYGMLFAGGFIVGYFMMIAMLKRELTADGGYAKEQVSDLAYSLTDKLCWCVVAGTIIGARLGHVFFYEWDYYSRHLSHIPKVWEGGLASHGGIVGIIISLFVFVTWARKVWPGLTVLRTMDLLSIPAAFVAFCIRLGNFVNQEIVGTPTSMPWAVLFAHPAEGVPAVPRHPVQLYEGLFYLVLFFGLAWVWRKGYHRHRTGLLVGLLFAFIFTWRFLMEFVKASQGGFATEWLQTGQILSIPFILGGLLLVWRSMRSANDAASSKPV